MKFLSDNVTVVAPEIMAAIEAANVGTAVSYGDDAITGRLDGLFSELFETEVSVLPVVSGTASNALAVSVLTPSYGAVYCHTESHINLEEAGAPEFYSGGAKLIPLGGAHAKYSAETLERALAIAEPGNVHMAKPSAVSVTQSTELGAVYSLDELHAISAVARARGLPFHMDGTRFANAMVALGCSPAELTWRLGVDVLCFGATKNGAMAAEAVVLFDTSLKEALAYQHKRSGHLLSKMRFVSAQLEAYIAEGRWLRYAENANRMAARLADGLAALHGAALAGPVEANEVFITLPDAVIEALIDEGWGLHRWMGPAATKVRLVGGFDSTEADVDGLIEAARRHLSGAAKPGAKRKRA